MDTVQTASSAFPPRRLPYFDRLFEAAKKTTVIQLRWPLVILCAYLLLYSPAVWLSPAQTDALLIFYLLTNATLYFVADEYFDSPYFYGPLLLFDTAILAIVLAVSGGATPDFYVACCLTLVLSCICNDSRGLIVVTILAPLLYGSIVFSSAALHDPSIYLRLPFPLVISMFYGYFAQVERLKRVAQQNEEQAGREREAAEEIGRHRGRLDVLQTVNAAMASSLASPRILDIFLETVLAHLPYAVATLRLRGPESGAIETAALKGIEESEREELNKALAFVDGIMQTQNALAVADARADELLGNKEFYKRNGLAALVAVPLLAQGERLGNLVLLSRERHEFASDEIRFLATLAGQGGMGIHHARLFEQMQKQANELRQSGRVKDEFLGVVSHELKTPLNVISGYTNMFFEGMLGEVSPIQEKALQTIARQTKELYGLINSVLQVSCIEARMLQAEFHEVNFWELLAELRAFYDYPLGKEVKLVWDFLPDLPTLRADRGKVKHILENLVNNAIKFTEKGSVTISARYHPAKKSMEFKIADTGIGIAKEQLPLIFEKFRQLDGSETRTYGGVGLGLYIVNQYTALLGGTIETESILGQGTTFKLTIPCKAKSVGAALEPSALSVAAGVA